MFKGLLSKTKNRIVNEKFFLYLVLIMDLLLILFYIFNYKILLHSDSATANLLAREQFVEDQFFPKGWYYVQDVWVLCINNFIGIIDSYIKNAVLSRALIVLLQNIIMAIVLWFVFLKLNSKKIGFMITISIIFSGVSDLFLEMFFGQAAYGNILLWIFLNILIVFYIMDCKLKTTKILFLCVLLLVLSTVMNITGMRYIFFFFLPFSFSLILYWIIEYISNNHHLVNKKPYLINIVFIISVAAVLGYLFHLRIINNTGFVKGVTNLVFSDSQNIINNVKILFMGYLQLFSALPRPGTSFLSIDGVSSFYRTIVLIILIILIPSYMLYKYRLLSNEFQKVMVLFYFVSSILTTYVYIFGSLTSSDLASSRYFLIILFLSIVLLGIFYDSFLQNKRIFIRMLMIICIIPLVFSSYFINMSNFFGVDRQNFKLVQKENRLDPVKKFLLNNNLEFGYASYWNAGALTVLSNYKLEVPAIDLNTLLPFYWLSSYRWYEGNFREGKTFLLLLDDESLRIDKNKLTSYLGLPSNIFRENNIEVLVYDFNIANKLPGWPITKESNQLIKGKDLPSMTGRIQNESRIVEEGTDKPGMIIFGPYNKLIKGKYSITMNYQADADSKNTIIAKWDIGYSESNKWKFLEGGNVVSTSKNIDKIYKEFYVDDNQVPIEFRTNYTGQGNLVINSIEIKRLE